NSGFVLSPSQCHFTSPCHHTMTRVAFPPGSCRLREAIASALASLSTLPWTAAAKAPGRREGTWHNNKIGVGLRPAAIAGLVSIVMTITDEDQALIDQEQSQSKDFIFMALFARMDTVAMAFAVSLLFALELGVATAVLILVGAPPGVPIGSNLSALGNILPGYSVTWFGCFIGAVWASIIGLVAGFLIATFWNFAHLVFTGLSALSSPRHITFSVRRSEPATASLKLDSTDGQLLSAAVRLNVCISALGVGLGLGLLLFVGTNLAVSL